MGFFDGLFGSLGFGEYADEYAEDMYGDDEEYENPWHEINTTAGAFCISCGRGISIGEDAWWNHKNRDVACSWDGQDLYDEEEERIFGQLIGEIFF